MQCFTSFPRRLLVCLRHHLLPLVLLGTNSRFCIPPFAGSYFLNLQRILCHRTWWTISSACVTLSYPLLGDDLHFSTKCLDYNTHTGKYKAGLLVVEAAEAFKGRQLNDSEYVKAAILGWVVVFVSLPPCTSIQVL